MFTELDASGGTGSPRWVQLYGIGRKGKRSQEGEIQVTVWAAPAGGGKGAAPGAPGAGSLQLPLRQRRFMRPAESY
jgi:hypothetical protein